MLLTADDRALANYKVFLEKICSSGQTAPASVGRQAERYNRVQQPRFNGTLTSGDEAENIWIEPESRVEDSVAPDKKLLGLFKRLRNRMMLWIKRLFGFRSPG